MIELFRSSEFTTYFNIVAVAFTIILCVFFYRRACMKYCRTKSQQVLNGVPGYCVSLGVICTFISIVISLLVLVNSNSTSDFSIFSVASSLIPAFSTSIIGNIYSLYYSMRIHEVIAEDEKVDLENFGDPVSNISKLLCEIRSMREVQSSQDSVFHQFMDTFTKNMRSFLQSTQDGFSKQVNKHLDCELSNLSVVMSAQVENMTNALSKLIENNQKTLSQMVSDMNSTYRDVCSQMNADLVQVKEQTTQRIELIGLETEKSTREMLQELKTGISLVSGEFAGTTKAMNAALQEAASGVKLDIKSINDNIKLNVEGMVEQLNEALQTPLELFMRDVEFMQGRIGQICTMYEQAMVGYRDALKSVHVQSELWEQSGERMRNVLDLVASNQNDIDNLINIIRNRQENITGLETQIQKVSATIGELQKLNLILSNLGMRESLDKKVA